MEPRPAGIREVMTSANARPARFVLVGIWNTVFGYLAYLGCLAVTDRIGLSYVVATVPATILAIAQAWATQRWLVFGGSTGAVASLLRFSAVYLVVYAVNTPLLVVLVSHFHLDPRIASAILNLASAATSYVVHHRFTFRLARRP